MAEGENTYSSRILGIVAGAVSVNSSLFLLYVSGYYSLFYIIVQWYLICSGIFLIAMSMNVNYGDGKVIRRLIRTLYFPLALALLIYNVIYRLPNPQYSYLIIIASVSYIIEAPLDDRIYRRMILDRYLLSSISGILMVSAISVALFFISALSYYLVASIILLAVSVFFAWQDKSQKIPAWYTPALVIVAILILAVSLISVTIRFSTDELLYDFLSAKFLITGHNPYVAGIFSGSITKYGIPPSAITFLTNGGYVSGFYYPLMSAYVFLPSVLLNFDPRFELVAFTALLYLVLSLNTSKIVSRHRYVLMALLMLSDMGVFISPATSIVDVIWVSFLALSIVTRKRPYISAAFFGLSLATKQLSWIFLPFYIIFQYREEGAFNSLKYFSVSLLVFIIANMPFILTSPATWFNSLIAPEVVQMVGAGQGLGAISFAGFYHISRSYFIIVMGVVAVLMMVLYCLEYRSMKYTAAVLPMVIMFFNYRLFINYLIFWPILAALFLPDLTVSALSEKVTVSHIRPNRKVGDNTRKRIGISTIIVILVFLLPAAFAPVFHSNSTNVLQVENVKILVSQGNVSGMIVTTAPNQYGHNLQFRVFPEMVNNDTYLSGSLWTTSDLNATGSAFTYILSPRSPEFLFPDKSPFRLEIYYGSMSQFINFSHGAE